MPERPYTEPGMPAHVLAQLLESDLLPLAARERFRQALAREQVDVSSWLVPGAQAPMRWFREACPDLDEDSAARLGYHAGEQARLTSYSLLSVPLVSAGSVSEALQLLRFMPLISNVLQPLLREGDDAVQVVLQVSSGDPVLDRIPLLYSAAAVRRLLMLLSGDLPGLVVDIAWPAPPSLRDHPDCLAGRLRFDAPLHAIRVPRATLAQVCRFSDPLTYQTAVAELDQRMARLSLPDDLAARVRRLVDAEPGQASLASVAEALHLSASTLKRRLEAAGTGFRPILETVLRERAMLAVTDPSRPLTAIVQELGYSDAANFAHAFKRWTGLPPGEFRRRHLLAPR